MEKAKVAIFEDSVDVQLTLVALLGFENHSTVLQAHTMIDAEHAIEELHENEVDVAIVDGNLSPGAIGCHEGAYITQLLHTKFQNLTVISYSGEQEIMGADIQYGKQQDIRGLLDIIRGL